MIMNSNEFCSKALDIANNYKTLYVLGCFGAPLNSKNKKRYTSNNTYNANRKTYINNATDDTFGFDCVCLIKGILWGWRGDKTKTYGGASYKSNNVPDAGANDMCNKYLTDVSKDFTRIVKGEAVWIDGHIGIYVGDGNVVECSPKWLNKVQVTHLGNIKEYKTGNYRIWTKHGKLPWVDYSVSESKTKATSSSKTTNATTSKSLTDIAKEVIKGLWGNGSERKKKLTESGYDPLIIQTLVNKLLK